ncbi:Ig-like domain-containing protein, partial [candidate division KSB1 bacterium]|nr:Ig-like domain-containing protein [candidate division KSB1 bacterium]
MGFGQNILVSWNANPEQDLWGYQIYYGTESNNYTTIIDVKNKTSHPINGLDVGTYYLVMTAYDSSGNESVFSTEHTFEIADQTAPTLTSLAIEQIDRIRIVFNEPIDQGAAQNVSNYTITGAANIVVQSASLQTDQRTVILNTTQHEVGSYTVTIGNIRDQATVPNTANDIVRNYTWGSTDSEPPLLVSVDPVRSDMLAITFSEPLEQASALILSNYSISPSVQISGSGIDGSMEIVYLTTAHHTHGVLYTLTVNNVTDGAGNAIVVNSTIQYTFEADDANPPELVAIRKNSVTQLEIDFNEAVESTSATNQANYIIDPNVSIQNVTLSPDEMTVTVTTQTHSGGSYTLTASGIQDQANPPNTMTSDQLEYEFASPDTDPPGIASYDMTSELVRITFDERVSQASAENVSNYSIDPYVNIDRVTLDAQETTVMIQTDSHPADTFTLTVTGVVDLANPPNVIDPNANSVTYTYTPPDREKPRLLHAQLLGANLVDLRFSEPLDRLSAEATENYSISPNIQITNATLSGDSLNHVYLNTSPHIQGQNYIAIVSNVKDTAETANVLAASSTANYVYPSVDNEAPRLVNAVLQGERFLQLEFSEALNETSARNLANYQITNGISVYDAGLDISQKKVFLTTDPHQPGVNYIVYVTGVTDLANPPNVIQNDNAFGYDSATDDVIPPFLQRPPHLFGSNLLELHFSEPVDPQSAQDINNYTLSNGINIQNINLSESSKDVWLYTNDHTPGEYSLTVGGVMDLAANPNRMQEATFTYQFTPIDNIAPYLVDTQIHNSTMIELIFSKTLDVASAEEKSNYMISGIYGEINIVNALLTNTYRNVYLQTDEHVLGDYVVAVQNVKAAGSDITVPPTTQKQYFYDEPDTEAPIVVSAVLQSDRTLLVKYSEAIEKVSAENDSNYRVNNNIEIENIFQTTAEDEVIIETTNHAPGTFTLTISNVRDASENQNPIQAYSQIQYTWNPNDTIAPELLSANLIFNNNLELKFSEAITSSMAKNILNYQIDPPVNILSAMLSDDLSTVWLVTEIHPPGFYAITVQNIEDRALPPNPINSQNQAVYNWAPPDTLPPELITVDLRTPMSLKLIFDESLSRQSAESITNYSVTPFIEITEAVLAANLTTVYLETSSHQPIVEYTVTARNLKDRAPVPNALQGPLSQTYSWISPDTSGPRITEAKLQGSTVLEILYSEKVEKTSAESRENYMIDPGVEILNAVLDTSSMLKVFLETTNHMPGIPYAVTARNVKDLAPIPNAIEANKWYSYTLSTSGGSADNQAPSIARIDAISPTQIDVIFTETVDEGSSEALANYSIDDTVRVVAAEIDSDHVRVRLTTTEHQVDKAYEILIRNIKDTAAQPNQMTSSKSVRYLMSQGVSVSDISRLGCDLLVVKEDGMLYSDRDYSIDQAPENLYNAIQILTLNDDKTNPSDAYIRFELCGDAKIYIGYDRRIEQLPSWMNDYKATGEQVISSRSTVYNLYSKRATSGRVTLGGNCGSLDDDMYLVFIQPQMASMKLLSNLSRTSYELSFVDVGDTYYIDRDYQIAAIPDT